MTATWTAHPEPIEARSTVADRATGEIVDTPAAGAIEPRMEQATTISPLDGQVVAMPGVPGHDEFMALAMQARILSLSGAAPPAIRNNPYVAFHVAMIGRDLGISPSAALNLIDVIGYDKKQADGGDNMQVSLSPQLLNGQIRRLGLGSITKVVERPDLGVAAALEPGGEYDIRCKALYPEHHAECRCHGVLGTSEFTWDDAITADLVDRRCTPGNHHTGDTWKDSGKPKSCGCRGGYRTYPKRMMWWRSSGYCADDFFPEAGLGLYSAEELGSVVDDEGRPIDPANVALPEGYGPAHEPTDDERAQQDGWDDMADFVATRERLNALAASMDKEGRRQLREWQKAEGIVIPGPKDGVLALIARGEFIKGDGFVDAPDPAPVAAGTPEVAPEAPMAPPEATEPPAAADTAPEAETAVERPVPTSAAMESLGRARLVAAGISEELLAIPSSRRTDDQRALVEAAVAGSDGAVLLRWSAEVVGAKRGLPTHAPPGTEDVEQPTLVRAAAALDQADDAVVDEISGLVGKMSERALTRALVNAGIDESGSKGEKQQRLALHMLHERTTAPQPAVIEEPADETGGDDGDPF